MILEISAILYNISMRSKYFLSVLFLFFAFGALDISAASLSLLPKGQTFNMGQEFTADLVVNTEDVKINAAQAVINFPPEVLQAVSVDRGKSIFNFWVEDPVISNGKISFIGGTSEEISGAPLLIFTAKFKAIGAGKADITLSEGVVTASDGKGTNVLSTVKGASVAVSTAVVPPEPAPIVQEQPKRIIREPAPAAKLPSIPELTVSLYPDPSKWYGHIGDVIVLWNVPDDIIQLAAIVDQIPKSVPTKFEKELFNGRNFGPLKEGIWYVHIRFKNNIGAGPTAHYRLAVDVAPPLPFDIESFEGLKISGVEEELRTDNPQPLLYFSTNDALSGMSHYLAQIDGAEAIKIDQGELKLPIQTPGKKKIVVSAVDNAGNVQARFLNLEIFPIPSPTITFVSPRIFAGEGDLLVRGTSQDEFIIKVSVRKKSEDIVVEGIATVDKSSNWEIVLDEPLKQGKYFIEVTAQDQRGALSLSVKSEIFQVRERPLFTVAGIGVTQFWFFTGLIIVLLGGFVLGWIFYRTWRVQLGRKAVVAQRDVVTAFDVIGKDIDTMLSSYADKRLNKREAAEVEFLLRKIKENSQKMQKYVVENIEEIPK